MTDYSAIKECDIRGVCPDAVDTPLLMLAGRNLAAQMAARAFAGTGASTVVVGGDGRRSTPMLRGALVQGLVANGASVFEVPGPLPSPALYWAREALAAQAVAIVTASHSPPQWNGLKLMNGPLPPTPDEVRELANESPALGRGAGRAHRLDGVLDCYRAARMMPWTARGLAGFAVAVDAGGGCQSGVATRVFADLGARVHALHDRLDPDFRERHPDCAIPAHLTALCAATPACGAALGVAFDGDGDRLAVIDDRGRHVPPEKVAMLLVDGPLAFAPGDVLIIDVKASMQLERAVEKRGGRALRVKSGHAYMKRAVMENHAVLGTEVSGHHFFGALHGIDDPLHGALMLASWLVESGVPLSERIDALPVFHLSPDLRLRIAADEIDALIKSLPEHFPDATISRTDGVRLVWPEGWLLARRSITEAACTLRFEGVDAAALASIRARFVAAYPALRAAVEDATGKF
jgi:phosphomannomutase